jgi:chromosome segregation ATPase
MTENVENLVLEHLRALRSEIQTMRTEMHSEFHDLKHRMSSLESEMVGVKRDVNHADATDARQQVSLDRIVERIERIERRLGFLDEQLSARMRQVWSGASLA